MDILIWSFRFFCSDWWRWDTTGQTSLQRLVTIMAILSICAGEEKDFRSRLLLVIDI
jgi:hypothetical protein